MYKTPSGYIILLLLFIQLHCSSQINMAVCANANTYTTEYIPLLQNKRIAVIANVTSCINKTSLVDSLKNLGIDIKLIFCPEHGFRGNADAGVKVSSSVDEKTGIPIISLYGKHKKPTKEDLKNIDIVLYDIQDIGVRFYTYISTMSLCMEACAENNKQFIVLDRPNPNGNYIDGPVLETKYKSFLGMHKVPLVYGMTCGEYAKMVNGEMWLANKVKCNLTVIPLKNYDRKKEYDLSIYPSPNIKNHLAINLYPTLGLFEGTIISLGRGTSEPFNQIGNPKLAKEFNYSFTPAATSLNKSPKYKDTTCFGQNFNAEKEKYINENKIQLSILIDFYKASAKEKALPFFDNNFNFHAGNKTLQTQITEGKSEEEIRKSWQSAITNFKQIRKKYLLYTDF